MKTFIFILLASVSALAADTGVRVVSTSATTNSLGIFTTETFTRGGQTNLVRMTGVKDGVVVYASHSFFHRGNLVATTMGTPNLTSFHTREGLPYQVSLELWPSKDVRGLHINGKDFNEMFHATNGVFYPAPDSELGNMDYTGKRPIASLTAEQVKALAMRLANNKASTIYHSEPFAAGQPAQFVAGHWIWVARQGFGRGDIQARVELAADGSTNSVDIQLFDSRNIIR